jgi:hypothetical protein
MSKLNLQPLVSIPIENLLLDPNNPRFAEDFSDDGAVSDSEVERKQTDILNHLRGADSVSGEDEQDFRYGLDELMKSMWSIGYVPIDQLVLRKLDNSEKYLIIEGNRRVSAAKLVLENDDRLIKEGRNPLSEDEQDMIVAAGKDLSKTRALSISRRESLMHLKANLLVKDGLTDEEYEEQMRIVLGVRHHGSLLEWRALPKAYNIYQEYMRIEPLLTAFQWEPNRSTRVVSIFSLGNKTPKKALRTYVAYKQLTDTGFLIKPSHFDLLSMVVSNTKITGSSELNYLQANSSTFELTDVSLSKIDTICQFENRDDIDETEENILECPDQFKILREPKFVKYFAKLIDATKNTHDGIRSLALSLLQKVEEREIPLIGLPYHPEQNATEELTNFINQTVWVEKLEGLLNRMDQLKQQSFGESPNDQMRLDELDDTMDTVFRPVFKLQQPE